jgi:osmotically-inducible protein OsmY
LRLLALLALLSTALPGCSVLHAYRACGLRGCADDAAVSAGVRELLQQHPALQPPNLIDVQTIDGVVYLYGLVDTDMQKRLAESVAAQARGAKRVVDSIGLRDGAF